jgi:hypothetical protein
MQFESLELPRFAKTSFTSLTAKLYLNYLPALSYITDDNTFSAELIFSTTISLSPNLL